MSGSNDQPVVERRSGRSDKWMLHKNIAQTGPIWLYQGRPTRRVGHKTHSALRGAGIRWRTAMDTKRSRLRILYSGYVQGVGFRYTVKSVAAGYEVTGTVRNLLNGCVELVVEGHREELESFRKAVREAGLDHFVRNEDVSWGEAAGEFLGFEIVK